MAGRWAFGPFVLDADTGELRRDGEPVRLPPQPFAALTLLVEREGALVTRDDLRGALWGDNTFVDVNAGVNFCIAQIRAALDDPAARSAYLVAVPRRGYRFAAPVRAIAATVEARAPWPAASIAPAPSRSSGRSSGRSSARRGWAAAGATALVAAAVVMLSVSWRGEAAVLPPLAAAERYERGAQGLLDAGPRELQARARYFNDAIQLHPRYADAYAGLADAKLLLGLYRVEAPSAAYAAAKAAATRAIAIDRRSADGHAALGAAQLLFEWNWSEARTSLE